MRFYVQSQTGKISILFAEPCETIENIKYMIEYTEKIPSGLQRLVCFGKALDNDYTLADYNIQEDSTLFLVLWNGEPENFAYIIDENGHEDYPKEYCPTVFPNVLQPPQIAQ